MYDNCRGEYLCKTALFMEKYGGFYAIFFAFGNFVYISCRNYVIIVMKMDWQNENDMLYWL